MYVDVRTHRGRQRETETQAHAHTTADCKLSNMKKECQEIMSILDADHVYQVWNAICQTKSAPSNTLCHMQQLVIETKSMMDR